MGRAKGAVITSVFTSGSNPDCSTNFLRVKHCNDALGFQLREGSAILTHALHFKLPKIINSLQRSVSIKRSFNGVK